MLKNPETGFFEEELDRYHIAADECLIEGLYAEQAEKGLTVCLRIGVGDIWQNISDELFEKIYDSYNADMLPECLSELIEIDDCFNPAWEARFAFSDTPLETENNIKQILAAHKQALLDLIEDKELNV